MDALEEFRSYMFVANRSAATIKTYTIAIRKLGPEPLEATSSQMLRILASYGQPSTRHVYRSAWQTFFRWAIEYGLTDMDPTRRVPVVSVPANTPRPLPAEDLQRLLTCTSGRVRALILLLTYSGIRSSESTLIRSRDFQQDASGNWRIHLSRVKGGRKASKVIPGWVVEQVREFFPLNKSVSAVQTKLYREFDRAGLLEENPHQLRHWFGTESLHASGGNLRVTQTMLGHRSMRTTELYTLVLDAEASDVVERLPRFGLDSIAVQAEAEPTLFDLPEAA